MFRNVYLSNPIRISIYDVRMDASKRANFFFSNRVSVQMMQIGFSALSGHVKIFCSVQFTRNKVVLTSRCFKELRFSPLLFYHRITYRWIIINKNYYSHVFRQRNVSFIYKHNFACITLTIFRFTFHNSQHVEFHHRFRMHFRIGAIFFTLDNSSN